MEYSWAVNRLKLSRAIGVLPLEASEERIKAKYIEFGGLLSNEDNTMENEEVQSEVTATPEIETAQSETVESTEVEASEEVATAEEITE